MAHELAGKKVAILAADGVERVELEQPRGALYGAGAMTELLSIHDGEIQARQHDLVPIGTFPVDKQVSDASVEDYLPVVTAGPEGHPGVRNTDVLPADGLRCGRRGQEAAAVSDGRGSRRQESKSSQESDQVRRRSWI